MSIKAPIVCPKCKNENTMRGTYEKGSWIRKCSAKDCGYEEKIPTDAWEEEL